MPIIYPNHRPRSGLMAPGGPAGHAMLQYPAGRGSVGNKQPALPPLQVKPPSPKKAAKKPQPLPKKFAAKVSCLSSKMTELRCMGTQIKPSNL